jgi:alkylhydroperoxidase/carboxymuconolactone decarboxylase family protein YurZ
LLLLGLIASGDGLGAVFCSATLWLHPELAPRDRRLVTVSALIANGQVTQLAGHLNRAMDTA